MRKFFAAAVGSAVALVGFAGAANASARIDLIWADTGTNRIGGFTSSVASSADIILRVILHGSPAGALGSGVSVDYSAALPSLTVAEFASTLSPPHLTTKFGTTINTGGRIVNLNAAAAPFAGNGIGLPPGLNAQLGTVTFRNNGSPTGTFEIRSDSNSPTDGVLDRKGRNIAHTTTFNSAFVTITGPDDVDGDGINNDSDNCLEAWNIMQDDTDVDGYGNLCDADYDDTGTVGFPDFLEFAAAYGGTGQEYCHTEPIPGCTAGFTDFLFFAGAYGGTPGPSGFSCAGTPPCP